MKFAIELNHWVTLIWISFDTGLWIDLLEKKLETIHEVAEEISELKSLLKQQLINNSTSEQSLASGSTTSLDVSSDTTKNVWHDTAKVNSMK